MATRALKKLTKKDNLKELEEINQKLANSSESDDQIETEFVPNKFNLVIELNFKKYWSSQPLSGLRLKQNRQFPLA